MKKFWWVGVLFFTVAFAAYWLTRGSQNPSDYAVGSPEWKYYMAEAETKVRPSTYEEMKYQAPAAVELRGPASGKHQ